MPMLKIYLAGLAVLAGAIVSNLLAGAAGLSTWYDFINSITVLGLTGAITGLTAINLGFLLFIYPALLGTCAYIVLSRHRLTHKPTSTQ